MFTTEDIKTMVRPLYESFPEIKKIVLFGSRARGDHETRSDIDLAIDCDMDIQYWDSISSFMEDVTLYPLDLIWIQHTSKNLMNRINQEGIVLYERESRPESH